MSAPAWLVPEFEEMSSPSKRNLFDESVIRSSNEEILFRAWKLAETQRKEAIIANETLQKQVKDLLARVMTLEAKSCSPMPSTSTAVDKPEYSTDEEELRKETEWIFQKNRSSKKRKASDSPIVSPECEKKKEKPSVQKVVPKQVTIHKPPPVIVEEQPSYDRLYRLLEASEIGTSFKTTLLSSGDIKINVENEGAYRELTRLLNESNIKWYSFENKQTRPIKVMVKKLHPSCEEKSIVQCLKSRNFKILSAVNILKRVDKKPLPMFMLSFENSEDVKKIYEIKEILGMKVTVEAVKSPKIIPQCKNCQMFGHTQKFCNKDSRCVRCAGKHHYSKCQKPKDGPPKCVNCKENHPANYRGCTVAKEIQKIRNSAVGKTLKTEATKTVSIAENKPSTSGQKSYAQATRSAQSEPQIKPKKSEDNVLSILSKLMLKLEALESDQKKIIGSINDRLDKIEKNNKTLKVKKQQNGKRS